MNAMHCPHETDPTVVERYACGTLDEPERTAFEDHFFGCAACLADLQGLQVARRVLGGEQRHPGPAAGRGSWRSRLPVWAGLGAAAALVVAVVARQYPVLDPSPTLSPPRPQPTAAPRGSDPTPAPSPGPPRPGPASSTAPSSPGTTPRERLADLVMVDPPPYVSLAMRGGAESDFDRAMAHYTANRFAVAAEGLRAVADVQPDADVAFFLGICELMLGRTAAAREWLERTAKTGTQPFADEAHFYLAKAALADGDLPRARRALERAVALDAGPEGEARRLLARLER